MNKKYIVAAIIVSVIVAGYTLLQKPQQKEETITVSGAFALYPLMIQWSNEYTQLHPDIKFEISAGGAGKGMTDALAGLVDIGMVSREIYDEEITKGAVYVAVAKDAVVISVNSQNPVLQQLLATGITSDKLKAIYITGEISTWGELINDPSITTSINIYTRSDSCGAAETMAAYMGYSQEDLQGTGVFGDPGLAEAVKTDTYAIGYNNVNYAYDIPTNTVVEGIKIVPLDLDEDGIIQSTEYFYDNRNNLITAIADGTYPSPPSRELNLVTKTKFTGATHDFIKWVLSEGQDSATEAGYVPLSKERQAEELAKLE